MDNYQGKKKDLDNFSKEDLNFFLNKLKSIKNNSSLSKIENKLVDFLLNQTQHLIQKKENYGNNNNRENLDIDENSQNMTSKFNNKKLLKSNLKEKVESFIIINLKTSGKNCQIRGILSSIHDDFVVLINGSEIYHIKIKEIASIKTRVRKGLSDKPEKKIKYKDQYYLEEEKCFDKPKKDSNEKKEDNDKNKQENNIKIKKSKKEYNVAEE